MALVRISKNWLWPPLMRQTLGEQGMWDGIQFTLDPVKRCDYIVILNRVVEPITVQCPPEHVWAIIQEPPTELHKFMHRGSASVYRVYTQDTSLRGPRYVHSQPGLPWHVNRSYDQLTQHPIPDKVRSISWITSNIVMHKGHRARLRFLEQLRRQLDFDLYGRGFNYIEDKWDGLAPYRYSIAVENFRNPYYWSEKIADCFLTWTMPIYYGCPRIENYFPAESMLLIDINDSLAVERIEDAISSNLWEHRLDAIAEARDLVLNRYQLFPLLAREIRTSEKSSKSYPSEAAPLVITNKMRWQDAVLSAPSRLRRLKTRGFLKRYSLWLNLKQ